MCEWLLGVILSISDESTTRGNEILPLRFAQGFGSRAQNNNWGTQYDKGLKKDKWETLNHQGNFG